MKEFDAAVIGGGVTGTLALRELTALGYRCCLLEAGSDLASGATRANSAIIHAGFDPLPGTKKARLNVLGAGLYPELAKKLDIPYRPVPSLVAAFSPEECGAVDTLYRRGLENGVSGLRILSKSELSRLEPNISESAECALFAPSAIVEPWTVAIAAAENAADNGAEVFRSCRVTEIGQSSDGYVLTARRPGDETLTLRARAVVNAAGVHADEVHALLAPPDYKITGKRGQYLVLDRGAAGLVNNILFPCPSEKGKGMLIFPEIHGRIMIGPDSEAVPDRDGTETVSAGLAAVKAAVAKYLRVPVPYGLTIRTFAGVRPAADRGDFIIEEAPGLPGFFDAAGIESPGLASAPAVAREIAALVGSRLGKRSLPDFNPFRRPRLTSAQAAARGIEGASTVVCRCEKVSEAEIVDAIRRRCGATTVKGVKLRTGSGAGGCQGGYCQPEIVKILARELGIDPCRVLYDGEGSNILTGRTRG